ncbi:helix-turn-helix domain-containing protein [Zobellia amurskyensis]|uniref:Helix-turn-helix domain-containing protein n=1 Tax=Zobellia amurskyensis TaxID=248905 RepID=A0A7X2ZSE3_9FLAO|nr:helix-turn-helix domain-containing protein [Zobellia amurskyensis]MUH35530.1 helix-turn-helix domain-containing protein [Zobellia amurskyensis]
MSISKKTFGSSFQSAGDQDFIAKLEAHIQASLNNNEFGVDSLAQAVGMSRSSLHRKLQKMLGVSTSQFIREYRLKRALEILKQEHITASETAYRVGFSSPTYFTTCFHKFYGFTPGEVKSRNSNEIESLIHGASSATEKTNIKKIMFWGGLFAMVMISVAAYLYSTTLEENESLTEIHSTPGEKSIAVMPLKNWTGNPDLEYVSDGMTDAVISSLTKISAIDKVIPFSSILNYKETDKTSKEIATELGVAKLLQGNLQISGDQIKINLQLIDGHSNDHLWSEEYVGDWKADEIFKIQTEVVEGVAEKMNATISENEMADIHIIPTKSREAYSYYLQAEFQRNKENKLSYSNAITLYKRAIDIDSNFVEAYVGLAHIWSFGGLVWGIYEERLAWNNAKILLQKALTINPDNKEVEEELYTGYFYYDWNFELVEKYYQATLENYVIDKTPAITTDYAIKTGRYKEAIAVMDKSIAINPSVGIFYSFKSGALMFLGQEKEAIALMETSIPLYSDTLFYLRESTKLYFYLGDYEKSKIQLRKILTQFPDYPPILMWLNAVYAQMDGDSKNVNKYLAELREEYNKGSSGSPAWFIALYYSHTKDYEKAFEWLQKSYDRHEVEMTWLREEPLLAAIRTDPRYKDLYEKVGFTKIGLPIKTTSKIPSP